MFQRTLVCLDGSPLAEQALGYVSESCRLPQTEMTLMQVSTSRITIPPLQSIHVPPFIKKVEDEPAPVSDIGVSAHVEPEVDTQLNQIAEEGLEIKQYLEDLAEPLRQNGINVRTLSLQGDPVRIILDYAVKNKVTLIALTTHGQGGLKKGLLGSTAQAILKDAAVPVMLIKPCVLPE